MTFLRSTKAWHKLPCAHAQFFDKELDGSVGECSATHGYDRSVKMTFAGEADDMGWIVPFGELKPIKAFLEYYFDHTAVFPANDPRVNEIIKISESTYPPLFVYRILPYGVSMEMSALFIWEQCNPFIHTMTNGRCYIETVECIEHDSNAASFSVLPHVAARQAKTAKVSLVTKSVWEWQEPKVALERYI